MVRRLYCFTCLAALAFWMGGLTFYALVVIPAGTRLLGSIQQGLLTQQVSHSMNWIGALTLAILLHSARYSAWRIASWLVMAATLLAQFWLHPHLDALIDSSVPSVSDSFYRWHQAYLVAVTVQWTAGLLFLWGLTSEIHGPVIDRSNGPV